MRAVLTALSASVAAFVGVAPAATNAQEPAYDTALFSSCLDRVAGEKGDLRSCIGVASDACMEQPGGQTTMGMISCLMAETRDWDMLLNAWYSKAMERAGQADEAQAGNSPSAEPTAPVLRQSQRNWVGFRDESCRYEGLRYQGGTMSGIAHAGCMLQLTAEQALRLRILAEAEG